MSKKKKVTTIKFINTIKTSMLSKSTTNFQNYFGIIDKSANSIHVKHLYLEIPALTYK